MDKVYQVTLLTNTGKYKPVSSLVRRREGMTVEEVRTEGIKKICGKRSWGNADLKRYGYTKVKMRLYDKAKIDKENAENYERIKEEKYASGEWKRPKGE